MNPDANQSDRDAQAVHDLQAAAYASLHAVYEREQPVDAVQAGLAAAYALAAVLIVVWMAGALQFRE